MKRNKMRITNIDKVTDILVGAIVNKALEYIINYDDFGTIEYYPYFIERGIKSGIVSFLFDGITFEENDDVETLIYSNKQINDLYEKFKEEYTPLYEHICWCVNELIDLKLKQGNKDSLLSEKLAEIFEVQKQIEQLRLEIAINENRTLQQQIKENEYNERVMELMTPEEVKVLNQKFLESGLTAENLSDAVMQKYLNSGIMESRKDEIIEAKNEKIRNLKEYKKLNEARNVLADN